MYILFIYMGASHAPLILRVRRRAVVGGGSSSLLDDIGRERGAPVPPPPTPADLDLDLVPPVALRLPVAPLPPSRLYSRTGGPTQELGRVGTRSESELGSLTGGATPSHDCIGRASIFTLLVLLLRSRFPAA